MRPHDCSASTRRSGAAASPLCHQACPLEHSDVLLHCGEAHVVMPSEGGDRRLVAQYARDDVAAGRVGEGGEGLVHSLSLHLLCNHMVARYPSGWHVARASGTRYLHFATATCATSASWSGLSRYSQWTILKRRPGQRQPKLGTRSSRVPVAGCLG